MELLRKEVQISCSLSHVLVPVYLQPSYGGVGGARWMDGPQLVCLQRESVIFRNEHCGNFEKQKPPFKPSILFSLVPFSFSFSVCSRRQLLYLSCLKTRPEKQDMPQRQGRNPFPLAPRLGLANSVVLLHHPISPSPSILDHGHPSGSSSTSVLQFSLFLHKEGPTHRAGAPRLRPCPINAITPHVTLIPVTLA